jgi:FkbH-like protein
MSGRGLAVDQAVAFLKDFPADLIAASFLSFRALPLYDFLLREADRLSPSEIAARVAELMAVIDGYLASLRDATDAPFLIHNVSGLPLTRYRKRLPVLAALSAGRRRVARAVNEAVSELVERIPNAILLDEAAAAEERGLRACEAATIPRRIVRQAFFHTSRFGEYLAPVYLDVFQSFRAISKVKVLLVDFDNTLWDGVMAEGRVVQRHDFQRLLQQLKAAGILLVAVSKNDPSNVRWNEMTLQPADFVLQKVNWNLKVQSIEEAARELDLGLDSFVFLDDNPAERELVRRQFPRISTLDPNDPIVLRWLRRMLSFPNTRETDEARERTETYRQQVRRREALNGQYDYPAMMASLELKASFGPATARDLDRLAELALRTNQFNTTAIRYRKAELKTMIAGDRHGVYVATLADKFGSYGLVAAVVVERSGSERTLAAFIMSCRALGFGLERLMLRSVLDAEGNEAEHFIGRVVLTDRNAPARGLYEENGFVSRGDGEWFLAADAARPERPPWLTVHGRE